MRGNHLNKLRNYRALVKENLSTNYTRLIHNLSILLWFFMKMLTNFFTLKALAREFHALLAGTSATAVYTQEKNQLVCTFGGAEQGERSLCVSVDPEATYAYLTGSARRSRRNSVDLFPSLAGLPAESVSIPSQDRLISISFSGSLRLILRLYGTAASNILLVDGNGIVQDTFKHRNELIGTGFSGERRPGVRVRRPLVRSCRVRAILAEAGMTKGVAVGHGGVPSRAGPRRRGG